MYTNQRNLEQNYTIDTARTQLEVFLGKDQLAFRNLSGQWCEGHLSFAVWSSVLPCFVKPRMDEDEDCNGLPCDFFSARLMELCSPRACQSPRELTSACSTRLPCSRDSRRSRMSGDKSPAWPSMGLWVVKFSSSFFFKGRRWFSSPSRWGFKDLYDMTFFKLFFKIFVLMICGPFILGLQLDSVFISKGSRQFESTMSSCCKFWETFHHSALPLAKSVGTSVFWKLPTEGIQCSRFDIYPWKLPIVIIEFSILLLGCGGS